MQASFDTCAYLRLERIAEVLEEAEERVRAAGVPVCVLMCVCMCAYMCPYMCTYVSLYVCLCVVKSADSGVAYTYTRI